MKSNVFIGELDAGQDDNFERLLHVPIAVDIYSSLDALCNARSQDYMEVWSKW